MTIKFAQLNRLAQIPPEVTIDIGPLDGGMDVSKAAWDPRMLQPPVKSPLSQNTRITEGVVTKAFGLTHLGAVSAASDLNIMALSEYEQLDGSKFLMRVMTTQLERWDGTAWLALTGTLAGLTTRFPSTLVVNDKFLLTNGVDKIQVWDGVDSTPVADFSASAPIALYLAHVLGRVIAADIINGTRDKEKIQISDDVDNSNFSTGNSDTVIIEEDSTERPSPITGLSFLFARFYVYRQHSIWIAKPTGLATAPFSFIESTTDIGLIAPKSLSRYKPIGDIFLGSDFQTYVFSGGAKPIPVGTPIQADMRASITDLSKVYGKVDLEQHRYWVMGPTFGSTFSNVAWVWEIDPWIEEGRLVWTRRTLPVEMVSFGFGDVPEPGSPGFINDETRLINDITELIDNWQLAETFRNLTIGGTDGFVRFPDRSAFVDEVFGSIAAQHDLPQLGSPGKEIWLDTVYIKYRTGGVGSQIELSFSTDGGTTFTNPRVISLPQAATGSSVSAFLGINIEHFIPRIRFTSNDRPDIIAVRFVARPRGEIR